MTSVVIVAIAIFGGTEGDRIVCAGSWSGYAAVTALGDAFKKNTAVEISVVGSNPRLIVPSLASGKVHVLMCSSREPADFGLAMSGCFPPGRGQP